MLPSPAMTAERGETVQRAGHLAAICVGVVGIDIPLDPLLDSGGYVLLDAGGGVLHWSETTRRLVRRKKAFPW